MATSQDLNGADWPELDSSIDLPPIKARYSMEELAQNYATLAINHNALWPKIVHALEYLRGHLIGAKGDAASARAAAEATREVARELQKEMKLLRETVQGQVAAKRLSLPPIMRPESPSTVDARVEAVSRKISGQFEQVARETSGPYVEADPQRLLKIVKSAIAEDAAAKLASENAARLAAIDAAEVAAKEARRKLRQKVIAGFMVAFATGAGAWAWGKAAGKLEARQTAMEEVRRELAVPAAATAVVVPIPPVSPAPASASTKH